MHIDEDTAFMIELIEEAGASKVDEGGYWLVSINDLSRLAAKLSAHARPAPN